MIDYICLSFVIKLKLDIQLLFFLAFNVIPPVIQKYTEGANLVMVPFKKYSFEQLTLRTLVNFITACFHMLLQRFTNT